MNLRVAGLGVREACGTFPTFLTNRGNIGLYVVLERDSGESNGKEKEESNGSWGYEGVLL